MKSWYALIVLTVIISGCNTSIDPDYRDAFEGQYIGVLSSSFWTLGGDFSSATSIDTVVVLAVDDSSVRIDAIDIAISVDGEFFEQGMSSTSSYYSVRFFNGDSLETHLNGGGLGGGYHSAFLGRKQ